MLRTNRQLPNSPTGCVIDCVSDGRRSSGNPDFTDSASTDRIELQIGTVKKLHIDCGNVRIRRYQILRNVPICDPPGSSIVLSSLQERHTDAKHNSSHDLIAGGLFAHHRSNVHDAGKTIHSYLVSERVYLHLAKLRTKRAKPILMLFVTWSG